MIISALAALLFFAVLVAYHYIRDLQRQRDTLKTHGEQAWQLYEKRDAEIRDLKAQPPLHPAEMPTAAERIAARRNTDRGFKPAGIGPTAINARELERQRKEQGPVDEFPTPSTDDILAAARETSNGTRTN